MFFFKNLEVCERAKALNKMVLLYLQRKRLPDLFLADQWKRVSTSIVLNIAEGTGRDTVPSKRHFFVIARGSVYECAALVETLQEVGILKEKEQEVLLREYERLSKMLHTLIKKAR